MSQKARIHEALKQGRYLTPMDALREFGCFRLGARVWDLRQSGFPVRSRMVGVGQAQFAEYYLEEADR